MASGKESPLAGARAPELGGGCEQDGNSCELFLSHSSRDMAAAQRLRQEFVSWGYTCTCDVFDAKTGADWEGGVIDALRRSFAVLVLAPVAALESKWVFAAIQIARYAAKPSFFLTTDSEAGVPSCSAPIEFIKAESHHGERAVPAELKQALERCRSSTSEGYSSPPRCDGAPRSSGPRDLQRESRQLARRVIELLEPRRHRAEGDAERGLLLALAAVEEYAWTVEAERALLTGLLLSKLMGRLEHDAAGIVEAHAAGSRVVTVGVGQATVWKLPECQEVQRFGGRITTAQLTGDGAHLVTGKANGHVNRWSVATKGEKAELGIYDAPVAQVVVFPSGAVFTLLEDGHGAFTGPEGEPGETLDALVDDVAPRLTARGTLALVRRNGAVTLHADDGTLLHTLQGEQQAVTALAVDAAGSTLVTGGEDGSVLIWNAENGMRASALDRHATAIRDVAVSPDGQTIATVCADHHVRLWRISGASICSLPTGSIRFERVELLSSERLITVSDDQIVRLWSTQGALLHPYVGLSGQATALLHFPELQCVVVASTEDKASVWSVAPGAERIALDHGGYAVECCAYAPGGGMVTGTVDGRLYTWASDGRRVQRVRAHSTAVTQLAVAEDGAVLTVAQKDAARLWQQGATEATASFGHASTIRSAAITSRGDRVAWGQLDGLIGLAPAASPEDASELVGHGKAVVSVSFSPDGCQLLSASEDGVASVWDTQSGKRLHQLRASGYALARAQFDPHGRCIVTVPRELGPVAVWDAFSGKKLSVLQAHDDEITDVAYSPCGRWLATASKDGLVRLWKAAKLDTRPVELVAHEGIPVRLRFCPRGERLVSADHAGIAVVWDTQSGSLLCMLAGHTGGLTDVQFSPDGQEVMTTSFDGTARLYAVPRREQLLAAVRSRVFRELTDKERHEHGLRTRERLEGVPPSSVA